MIKWIALFLNHCTVAIWLDGQTCDQEAVQIGVPQRLSAAPILFMLFTVVLCKILTKDNKKAEIKIYGYIDDGFVIVRDSTKNRTSAKIQAIICNVEACTTKNRMVFD